jgi:hypothetical protein
MNNENDVNWLGPVWDEINEGVSKEVNKVRVSKKVFETMTFDDNPPQIADEVINFADLSC